MSRMDQPWERRVSATGNRLHWAQAGHPYALCGSNLAEGDGRGPSPELLADCGSCEGKRAKLRRVASEGKSAATAERRRGP